MDAKAWVTVVFGLIGGMGLFLYGIGLMSDGLQKVAGEKLKIFLKKLTSNRIIGTFVGIIITILMQSSTAATVMVVGFVNAGMMNLTQALGVVLGAHVGTTITAQIIAFKITAFAMPAIGVGAIIVVFIKKTSARYIGQVILGIGLLFFGMTTMTGACAPLSSNVELASIFITFSHYPILGVLAGTVVTIMMQSSAATIGMTIALATTGLVDYYGAIALVLGDNIGTTITANIAAIGGSRTAKQAALGHLLISVFGVCYMLIFFKPFAAFVDWLTPGSPAFMAADGAHPYMARHIANIHTMFNIINVCVVLPLIPLLAKVCEKLIKTDITQKYHLTHLSDVMMGTPEIAMSQVRSEVGRMSVITLDMLNDTADAITKNDRSKADKISMYEKTLDGFQSEIIGFIDKLSIRSISQRTAEDLISMRQAVHAMEEIGDYAKKVVKITIKMFDKKHELSSTANEELNNIFDTVISFASSTFQAFANGKHLPAGILDLEDEIDDMNKQFRKNHIKRLNKGLCSAEVGIYYVDILSYLEKMGDNVFIVAQFAVGEEQE